MKQTVYSILNYEEIIARYIKATEPLDGPSCFPVEISFSAGNQVEPPVISVQVSETQSDGSERILYITGTDQNTPLESFLSCLDRLREVVMTALLAQANGISYEEASKKPSKEENDEDFSAF